MINKFNEKIKQIKIRNKHLYLVASSEEFETEDEFLDAIASAINDGVEIVQLKEKNNSANNFLHLAQKVKQLCLQFDATFIINDRLDIALLVEADGVHLEQGDLDIKSAREVLGDTAIVGIYANTTEQILKSVDDDVDYIFTENNLNIYKNINIPTFKLIEIKSNNTQYYKLSNK